MTPLVLDEAIGGRVVDAYNKTGRPVPISIPGDERQFEVVCISDLEPELTETIAYEEKLHHLADQMIKIDLDDGVKVNYAKFQDVLAKIK